MKDFEDLTVYLKKVMLIKYQNELSIVYHWVYQWIHHLGVVLTWNKEKVPRIKIQVFKRDNWLRVKLDFEILKKIYIVFVKNSKIKTSF